MDSIDLTPNCWIKAEGNLIILTSGNTIQSYHKDYYKFIPSNNTQRDFISRYKLNSIPDLDTELKQLLNIDHLKKALIRHFNNIDRLRYLSGDDALIKRRRILKYKNTIQKYLNELRQDSNFNIETIEKRISLLYSGRYVNARKVVVA